MFKKILRIVFMALILSKVLHAQETKFQISVTIKGYKDTLCYLVNYYGNTNQLKDTARVINGSFVFKGNVDLGGGIYILVGQMKNIIFEFIIDKEKKFSIESDMSDLVGNMKFKGSPENTLFYEYRKHAVLLENEVSPLIKIKESIQDNPDSVNLIQEKIDAINKEISDYKNEFINKYPGSFIGKVFKASKDPVIPEAIIIADEKTDSDNAYWYYKNHYWDNFDFTDDRLLRTPVYDVRLKQYFEKVVIQYPDTIIAEADRLIEKTRSNKEMFKFAVWYITNTYERSNLMGFDVIFVHMVETYYMTNQAFWVTPSVLQNITQRAMEIKNKLIGVIAPEIILLDTNNQIVSMHNIKSNFIIVYFWDPDCGHCQKETPKLREFYNEVKDSIGLVVYAISTDTDLERWKKYIRDNNLNWINVTDANDQHKIRTTYDVATTPMTYLLDKDKKIIAKKLYVEPLRKFLDYYLEKEKTK